MTGDSIADAARWFCRDQIVERIVQTVHGRRRPFDGSRSDTETALSVIRLSAILLREIATVRRLAEIARGVGVYFAATGPIPAERGFAEGILDNLLDGLPPPTWSPAAVAAVRRFRQ